MTLKELKILMALNGGDRIPYIEAEIFADTDLCTHYLQDLCKDYYWYRDTQLMPNNAFLAYAYSSSLSGHRWPEAEALIATNRKYAKSYNLAFGTNI